MIAYYIEKIKTENVYIPVWALGYIMRQDTNGLSSNQLNEIEEYLRVKNIRSVEPIEGKLDCLAKRPAFGEVGTKCHECKITYFYDYDFVQTGVIKKDDNSVVLQFLCNKEELTELGNNMTLYTDNEVPNIIDIAENEVIPFSNEVQEIISFLNISRYGGIPMTCAVLNCIDSFPEFAKREIERIYTEIRGSIRYIENNLFLIQVCGK